jgi:uncharacterized protein YukJ
VWKGKALQRRPGFGRSPHYQILCRDDNVHYRVSVNVRSRFRPFDLLYHMDAHFDHPVCASLERLPAGFTRLRHELGDPALDYIRGNLFDRSRMRPLPFDAPGPDNDLNERLDECVARAISDVDAWLYAFGEPWKSENRRDNCFGFRPTNGMHDVHMNQGNDDLFARDDGVWQDGALMIHFRLERRWVAFFLAYQSQSWQTSERTGRRILARPKRHRRPSRPWRAARRIA